MHVGSFFLASLVAARCHCGLHVLLPFDGRRGFDQNDKGSQDRPGVLEEEGAWHMIRAVLYMDLQLPNNGAPANRRPAAQSGGSGNLSAIIPADRAVPAAVAELVRWARCR